MAAEPFVAWLGALGLAQYAEGFAANGVDDVDALRLLSEADLAQLGVLLGHRRKLSRALAVPTPPAAVGGPPGVAAWTVYLDSPASCSVLNASPNGWQCAAAMQQLQMQDYQYNPSAPYWGFASWNAFFTRPLVPGARPIASPNDDKIVTSACDSTVYVVETDVQRSSAFWLKSQPHSLADMLAGADEYVDGFVGGTVYQAFLNPFNYHRWHSPVAGTVKKAFVREGLYLSQADSEGEDPTIQDWSEGYITQVQTRATIVIDADDPTIGAVAVMPVGMVEISSCVIDPTLAIGAHVAKGQELGYFQFGGSTHCLVFRPGAVEITRKKGDVLQVGQPIARAR